MNTLNVKPRQKNSNLTITRLLKSLLLIPALILPGILGNQSIAQLPAVGSSSSAETISSLTGSLKKDVVLLKWQVSSDQNTLDFEIQHNGNGAAWNTIGVIKTATTSNSVQNYSFVHANPAKGVNNYRLVQTDAEGRSTYSNSVSLVNISEGKQLVVYSTPLNNNSLIIQLQKAATVSLYNSSGVLVYQKSLPAGMQDIDITGFAKGVYQLQAGEESAKVMIQ